MELQLELTALAQAVGADVKALRTDVVALQATSAAETIFTLTGTTPVITPDSGGIQLWTLTANSTPTLGTWAAGKGLTLMLTAGAFSVAWPAITWATADGNAPTPKTSGVTIIVLWKVGTTVYGK